MPRQKELFFAASVINSFLKVYGHLTSSTPSSPMRPSGDAPNTPPSSNQRPVSTGWIPDIWLKHWMARDSLSTPQATALTLLMSSRRFMSEGVVRFALRTTPKLLAVSLPFLAWCQAGLLLWPAVIWLTCLITSSPIFFPHQWNVPIDSLLLFVLKNIRKILFPRSFWGVAGMGLRFRAHQPTKNGELAVIS